MLASLRGSSDYMNIEHLIALTETNNSNCCVYFRRKPKLLRGRHTFENNRIWSAFTRGATVLYPIKRYCKQLLTGSTLTVEHVVELSYYETAIDILSVLAGLFCRSAACCARKTHSCCKRYLLVGLCEFNASWGSNLLSVFRWGIIWWDASFPEVLNLFDRNLPDFYILYGQYWAIKYWRLSWAVATIVFWISASSAFLI